MSTPFTKVEGLGNDFVLIDARVQPLVLRPEQAVALCDRHRGVGADGVLVLSPSARALAQLAIWNADGSQAEMCGNGLRCAATLLLGETQRDEILIETCAGVHRCRREGSPESGSVWVELVGLSVGPPETIEVRTAEAREDAMPLSLSGRRVSLGNPHFVVFGGADATRAAQLGPAVERHRAFAPDRINVEFCELKSGAPPKLPFGLKVRVWERGVGLTLACGTGAAAAAAAAWVDGHVPRGPTTVDLPGGSVRIDPVNDQALGLCGVAHRVFAGQVDLG